METHTEKGKHPQEALPVDALEAVDLAQLAVANALAGIFGGFDIKEFLQVIVDEARTVAGAEYAALGIVGEPGQPFTPWVFSGIGREQAATMGRHPRPVGLLGEVVHAGKSIRLRDLHEHKAFGGFPAHHPEMEGFLRVPIRYRGASRGNLYLANKRGSREFTKEDQESIEMLVERVATALEIGRLRQIEARERTRLELLAKGGPALSESLDYETTLEAIGTLIVPSVAEMCTLVLVDGDGTSRKVIARHVDPDKQKLLEGLLGSRPAGMIPESRREVLNSGQPHLVREITDELLVRTIPDPAHREIVRKVTLKSSVAVPLVLRGKTVGVLEVGESRRRLGEEDLPLVQEIAHLATFAIENARLYQAVEHHEKQQRFLAEVGAALASSLDYQETLASVARLAVRDLADWCVVDLVDNRGRARRLKVVHANSAKAAACEAFQQFPLDRRRPHLASSVLETKQPILMSEVKEGYLESIAQSEERLRTLRELGVRSFMALPLLARDHLLGVLILVSSKPARRYGAEDLSFAEKLAHGAALAVENARLYQTAQRAIQARDAVMGIVSHDLRSPLSAIQMCTELFAKDDPQLVKPVAIIKRSVDVMVRLISDLRDLGSIEAGHLSIRTRPEASAGLVKDAIDGITDAVAQKSLRLVVKMPARDRVLDCDRIRILQVLTNLLSNAIKFTPPGGSITLSMMEAEPGQARFSVEDTGAGIAEADLPHVFERYWQAGTTAHLGTGLGLAITKGIVEAHGGTISVESRVGHGTTFSFTLRLAPDQAVRSHQPTCEASGVRVLVVDDEPNALSALASLLEDEGFVVETAADGLAALAKVRELAPDILVVDVEMPGLKGDDLARDIRNDLPDLPVILMTGHGDQVVATARMELGADYITKPLAIADLVSAIYRGLEKERMNQR